MKFILFLLVFVVIAVALVWVLGVVVEFFSEDRRDQRKSKKRSNATLVTKTKQLHEAQRALLKIAANDSGNPVLDAQLALETIHSLDRQELEN